MLDCRKRLRGFMWMKRAAGAAAESLAVSLLLLPPLLLLLLVLLLLLWSLNRARCRSPARDNDTPAHCLERAISRTHCVAIDLALSMVADEKLVWASRVKWDLQHRNVYPEGGGWGIRSPFFGSSADLHIPV